MKLISEDYLIHHGIKGQKWGVRRYQNSDGTYTPEGKRRYSKYHKDLKKRVNEIRDLMIDENGFMREPTGKRNHMRGSYLDEYPEAKAKARKLIDDAVAKNGELVLNDLYDIDEYTADRIIDAHDEDKYELARAGKNKGWVLKKLNSKTEYEPIKTGDDLKRFYEETDNILFEMNDLLVDKKNKYGVSQKTLLKENEEQYLKLQKEYDDRNKYMEKVLKKNPELGKIRIN